MRKKLLLLALSMFWALPVFAQSVDTAWVRRYNGPGNREDEAHAVVVDTFGNVYVTGRSVQSQTASSYITIKYYPNGDTAWTRAWGEPSSQYYDAAFAEAIDASGNIYVTGGNAGDYTTIRYTSNGDTAWVRKYNGTGNYDDWAYGIVLDASGNIYLTGSSYGGINTGWDYATIKYFADGDTAWVRRYNGTGNQDDAGYSITVDDSGYVYVAAWSIGIGSSWDWATIKYKPNGDTLWVRRYNGTENGEDFARAIAVDRSRNVYVTGMALMTGSYYDYVTIKYYPNGDTAWMKTYNGPGNYYDEARSIALDSSGNVYITGGSRGGDSRDDYATIKYSSDGDEQWVRRYNGTGNFNDQANVIKVDGFGNAYVSGWSYGTDAGPDYATVKYNTNGDEVWSQRYTGPGAMQDEVLGMTLDRFGNIYVVGRSVGSGSSFDYVTIKYVQFQRGDANVDKKVTVADVVYLVNFLFKGGPAPNPIQSGDANCDSKVNLADIVYLVAYLFKGGPQPCI